MLDANESAPGFNLLPHGDAMGVNILSFVLMSFHFVIHVRWVNPVASKRAKVDSWSFIIFTFQVSEIVLRSHSMLETTKKRQLVQGVLAPFVIFIKGPSSVKLKRPKMLDSSHVSGLLFAPELQLHLCRMCFASMKSYKDPVWSSLTSSCMTLRIP